MSTTTPLRCKHLRPEPATVLQETVAQVCVDCTQPLRLEFGCPDCQWVETPSRLCDTANKPPEPMLARACEEHS